MFRLRDIFTFLATATMALSVVPAAAAQGNCSLDASGVAFTGLEQETRLFVSGNFHNRQNRTAVPSAAKDALRDLAYVSTKEITDPITNVKRETNVLSVLINDGGNGCFRRPIIPPLGSPDVEVGADPTLIEHGMFDNENIDIEDIAIIDTHIDQFNRRPLLRILFGDGAGHFTPGRGTTVFPLAEGEKPIAMATGHFRGSQKPLDIAIVSIQENPSATSGGVLRVLFNNGRGEFDDPTVPSPPPVSLPNFVPEAMVVSDQFRGRCKTDCKTDLVIKESGPRRILYLQNAGNGTFPIIRPSGGAQDGAQDFRAGNVASLLVGITDVGRDKLDIITFDKDMTLRIFANDGSGVFSPSKPIDWQNQEKDKYRFIGVERFFPEPGDQGLRLMAAVTRVKDNKSSEGLLTLQSDKVGGVKLASFLEFKLSPPAEQSHQSFRFSETNESPHPSIPTLNISDAILGEFLKEDGVDKIALAAIAQPTAKEVRLDKCPGDTDEGAKDIGAVTCPPPRPTPEQLCPTASNVRCPPAPPDQPPFGVPHRPFTMTCEIGTKPLIAEAPIVGGRDCLCITCKDDCIPMPARHIPAPPPFDGCRKIMRFNTPVVILFGAPSQK